MPLDERSKPTGKVNGYKMNVTDLVTEVIDRGKLNHYNSDEDLRKVFGVKNLELFTPNSAEQLKHAKTKQEANDIITASIASVSDKDPAKEYTLAAMHKVGEDFKATRA